MSKNSGNFLLTFAVVFCLVYAGSRFIKLVVSRIPPYKVGTCFKPVDSISSLQFKITKNNILGGYSDIAAKSEYINENIKESFADLRSEDDIVPTNCL